MIINEDDYLSHYGTPRHSGRYPWGSGGEDHTNTRNMTLLQDNEALKTKGLTEADIGQGKKMSTTQLRAEKSIAKNKARQDNINTAHRLKEKGMSTNAIAKQMGVPEPTVRNYLKPGEADKAGKLVSTANMLRDHVNENGLTDVGKGVESRLGITSTRLSTAVEMLVQEGYVVHTLNTPQLMTRKNTKRKVLCPPGTTQKEVWQNQDKITIPSASSDDYGKTYTKPAPPLSINPKRVGIVYGDEGGDQADGVIYVRPGVKDISIGGVSYAQVRVKVGDNNYLKGMAIYKDDLPDGVDIQFNTSKKNTGNKLDVMKPLTEDPDLPFGSIVRQIVDKPGDPNAKPTSVMNIVNDDADWEKWSRTLSSQMLSKQSPVLAKTQLDMTYDRRLREYEQIKKLTNPTVREQLLLDFAGSTDTASVHLKAAAMPGQAVKVLLPISTISPNQIYAPSFKNGERVVLIRHPHGGTFEIPELIVNNNNAEGKKLLGPKAKIAVGIHHDVARHLSGADFDGDTVLVIPNQSGRIKATGALDELINFDPRASYPEYPGMKIMRNTQTEMGMISNLITDMTIKQASHAEIARAVRHSMVVIDAENHRLDWKASYQDNAIRDLKEKYQRQPDGKGGASTLISRAKSELRVDDRVERPQSEGGPIDPTTGRLVFKPTNRTHWKTGKPLQIKTTQLAETEDAFTLSSGTPIEAHYATHSNKLKALANKARMDALRTPALERSPSAAKIYANEVDSLNGKLSIAKKNAPLERKAQALAASEVKMKKQYNPNMDKDTYKKVQTQALTEARNRTGAGKERIVFTDKEWDAIQAGAISDSKLTEILTHADMARVRELATPQSKTLMSKADVNRANAMFALGYTRAEVADSLGVSVSTLDVATVE